MATVAAETRRAAGSIRPSRRRTSPCGGPTTGCGALEDELFAGFDLTAQQYNLLRLLRAAHPNRVPTLALAERLVSRAPDITRMLDKLEQRGLITRDPLGGRPPDRAGRRSPRRADPARPDRRPAARLPRSGSSGTCPRPN